MDTNYGFWDTLQDLDTLMEACREGLEGKRDCYNRQEREDNYRTTLETLYKIKTFVMDRCAKDTSALPDLKDIRLYVY